MENEDGLTAGWAGKGLKRAAAVAAGPVVAVRELSSSSRQSAERSQATYR